MLHAIPTTPLYDRLKQAGRLNDDEASERYGTNVIPLGMSREQLRDGFVEVMQSAYTPDAYFERLNSLFIDENFKFTMHQLPYWVSQRVAWAKRCLLNYVRFGVVASRLLSMVKDEGLRSRYKRQLCAHGPLEMARAAYPVRLRPQGRNALSLCRAHACHGAA